MTEPDPSDAAHEEVAALRRRLGEQREELLRLEARDLLPQVIGGLAHEFNNPLTAILGQAQRLQRVRSDGDDVRRRADVIVAEVQRCIALVEGLRGYASPPRSATALCRVEQAISQAAELLRQRGERPPEIVFAGPLPPLQAAQRPLIQAVAQVLDNARRAGAQRVTVSAAHEGQRVRVCLDNDGATPGAEELANALRPFFSTRTNDGCSGLGLSVAAALLREMGGSLHFAAGPAGSGARISLLLAGADDDDLTPRANPLLLDNLVLVVDDEPLVAELLQDALQECGWRSRCCASAQEALALLEREPVRAALIDRRLGDGDGLALLREIAQRHPRLRGRIAIVTGDRDDPAVLATAREFDCPLLGKPFHLQQINDVLRRILGD